MAKAPIKHIVVVSDLHAGCRMGLCPPEPQALTGGGSYLASAVQRKVYDWWMLFWSTVEKRIGKDKYAVVVNGDLMDGVHHNSTTQISHNLSDQADIAYELLQPVAKRACGRFFVIRGTEAHGGKSCEEEEKLANRLHAVPNDSKDCSRWELLLSLGDKLVHFTHHVGTSASLGTEGTAVNKELEQAIVEAGRWSDIRPDMLVRSHRHRHIRLDVPVSRGVITGVVTPGWQLPTPFVYKIAGGRNTRTQIGGVVISDNSIDNRLEVFSWVRAVEKPKPEIVTL